MPKNAKITQKLWNYIRSKTNSQDKIGDLIVKGESKQIKLLAQIKKRQTSYVTISLEFSIKIHAVKIYLAKMWIFICLIITSSHVKS